MVHRPFDGSLRSGALVALRLLAAVVAVLLATGAVPAGATWQGDPTAPPRDAGDDGQVVPGRSAAWDVVEPVGLASGGGGVEDGSGATTASAPTDCLGWPARRVRYTSDGVIHLEGCGQTFTLTEVAASSAVGPMRLELVDPANKIWFLKVKLKVEEGATLRVIGGVAGDANWLRLRSDDSSGIWLRAEKGNLLFKDTRVTSWDATRNAVDTTYAVGADGSGGRSYVAARSLLTKGRQTAPPTACGVNGGSQEPYEARMDVVNSEISYLGYNAGESYGIAWKVYYKVDPADPNDAPPPGRQLYAMVDVFGDVRGSTFQHNYFGSYTFGAYCMNWTGNIFAENVQYGLDPHDDSDYLTISGNTFRDNGNHGVICSIECNNLAITGNQSSGNLHGIMIHRSVNGALIEGNAVHDNRGAGIAIFDSHDAVVRGNTVTNNAEAAVRLSVGSSRNLIENNSLTGLAPNGTGSGYVLYTYKGSDAPTSGDGLPKQNIFRNNRLVGYKRPLLKIGEATDNRFEGNTIAGAVSEFEFRLATGNRVRDGEVGKTITIILDSASMTTLEDSRGYIWRLPESGLSTAAGVAGSTMSLSYANTGGRAAVTTLDFRVYPSNGSVAVRLGAWDAGARSWSESSSTTTGPVGHAMGGLQAGACYAVTANGASIGVFRADDGGRIGFSYGRGYGGTVAFALAAAACGSTAPELSHKLYLPLVIR